MKKYPSIKCLHLHENSRFNLIKYKQINKLKSLLLKCLTSIDFCYESYHTHFHKLRNT